MDNTAAMLQYECMTDSPLSMRAFVEDNDGQDSFDTAAPYEGPRAPIEEEMERAAIQKHL